MTPIDLSTMTPGPAIAVGGDPTGIAGAPSSGTAYVSGGDSITPIDLQTNVAGKPIGVGTTAEALALAPGGKTAWVAGGDGTLVNVDLGQRYGHPAGARRQSALGGGDRRRPQIHGLSDWGCAATGVAQSGLRSEGGPSTGSLEDQKRHLSAKSESQALVEADGHGVLARGVKEGRSRRGRVPTPPWPGP